ncbi:MAG: hypothetical protein EYC62_03425 [Alphaproteobacteria bacterium]|nr:MAG: hypothetical protein EYC62_03425 [Alphaproteobacteria bacterium]
MTKTSVINNRHRTKNRLQKTYSGAAVVAAAISLGGTTGAVTAAPQPDRVVYVASHAKKSRPTEPVADTYLMHQLASKRNDNGRLIIRAPDSETEIRSKEGFNLDLFLDEIARLRLDRKIIEQTTPTQKTWRQQNVEAMINAIFVESDRWGEVNETLGRNRVYLPRPTLATVQSVEDWLKTPVVQRKIAAKMRELTNSGNIMAGPLAHDLAVVVRDVAMDAHPRGKDRRIKPRITTHARETVEAALVYAASSPNSRRR